MTLQEKWPTLTELHQQKQLCCRRTKTKTNVLCAFGVNLLMEINRRNT